MHHINFQLTKSTNKTEPISEETNRTTTSTITPKFTKSVYSDRS